MISGDIEAEILRLHHAEKWPVGTIASQLQLHHSSVTRVIARAGLEPKALKRRPSIVDPYVPFMIETLTKFPRLRASRLYQMVRERGYRGSADHLRHTVAGLRPRPPASAYLRLRTLAGEQGQVDWGHFGKVQVGAATRTLWAFVMVLSWSRNIFLRFYLSAAMPSFLRGHVEAFRHFGGVPRVLLYDNLKSAVLERVGQHIRFHPTLVSLSAHYLFEPRPVAPARGNEKGRVERAIRYVRDSFFAARAWNDLADLNAQAHAWTTGEASDRRWPEDARRRVGEVFTEEQPLLRSLPDNEFPTEERVEVDIGKTPYARFDLNDYSVPHNYVRRTLVVVATITTVRVLDGADVLATHARSYSRGQQVENPDHIRALVEEKSLGSRGRGLRRLTHAVPNAEKLLARAAERGGNLGSMTAGLLKTLGSVSPAELDLAIDDVLERDLVTVSAVRQALDQRRAKQGKPLTVITRFSSNPRAADVVVNTHRLETYDRVNKKDDHEEA
jgi:transposase